MKVFVPPPVSTSLASTLHLCKALHELNFTVCGAPLHGDSDDAVAMLQELSSAEVVVGFDEPHSFPYYGMAAGQEKMLVLVSSHAVDPSDEQAYRAALEDLELPLILAQLPNLVLVPTVQAAVDTVSQYHSARQILGGTICASTKGWAKVVPIDTVLRGATPKYQGKPLEWALVFAGSLVQLRDGVLDSGVYREIVRISQDITVVGSDFNAIVAALKDHLNSTLGARYREAALSGAAGNPPAVSAPLVRGPEVPGGAQC